MEEKHQIARAAGVMSAATFISRLLGFARDMVLALFFGASGVSDAFFVAQRIPNLLRGLFAEGAMSSSVVPVLTDYDKTKSPEETRQLVSITLGFILLVVGTLCVLGTIFAPQVVTVIAPGFLSDPKKFALTVKLTRVMMPFLLFISLASVLMGALNTRRVFFIPALAPAMLNIAIIASVFILGRRFMEPVMAAAVGVAIGGLAQVLIQSPSMLRQGLSLAPSLSFSHPGLKTILTLALPMTLGVAVAQINILVSNILASFLATGSITYLFYSMRLIQFPVGIFGVAMGTALLPSLSAHAVSGDMDALREDFSYALRLLMFISIPSMAGLIALRVPIISTLLQRGAFDYTATEGTASALLYYSLGIWAMVGVRVLASAFYSLKDTKRPVKAAIVALIANAALSAALMFPMGHSGLALANAISSTINLLLLGYMLKDRFGGLDAKRVARSILKSLAASALMALAATAAAKGGPWGVQGMGALKALHLGRAIAVSVAVYFMISFLMRSEELGYVTGLFKRKFSREKTQ